MPTKGWFLNVNNLAYGEGLGGSSRHGDSPVQLVFDQCARRRAGVGRPSWLQAR
jgi:hypothetical protein